MSLFAPEKLMAMMGINPTEITAQIDGFKVGMAQTIGHFNNRLSEVIANQQRLEHKLDCLLAVLCPPARSSEDAYNKDGSENE